MRARPRISGPVAIAALTGILPAACSTEGPDGASDGSQLADLTRVEARLVDRVHPDVEAGLLPAWSFGHDRRLVLSAPAPRESSPTDDFARIAAADLAPDASTRSVQTPAELAGSEAAMQGARTASTGSGGSVIHVVDVAVPERGELRFAVARVAAGATRFAIDACREGGGCEQLYCEVVDEAAGWLDRRVDLARLGGETVELRFDAPIVRGASREGEDAFAPSANECTRRLPPPTAPDATSSAPPPVGGVFANPTVLARASAAEAPVSVLLVSLDTLGARHLGAYGGRRDTSPFLDDFFMRRGLVIDRFISSEVHTGPSHMSLFTSLPPTAHGVHAGRLGRLPYTVETLASRMRAAGRVTGAVTEDAAIFVGGGFERGFDTYREVRRKGGSGGIVPTFDAGRAWLDDHADTPFFFFLHTYETHWTFEPPPPYDTLFEGDGLVDADHLGEDYALTRYEQEIRFVDDQMKALLEYLNHAGVLDRTVVVVTSDHGEAFLEHERVGHGDQLYGEVIHVPLFVAGPGIPSGVRRSGPMAQIDLAPTLLELVGASSLPDAMGASVLGWWRGNVGPPERPAFSEAWFQSGRGLTPRGKAHRIANGGPIRAMTTRRHRLIEKRPRETVPAYELYSLEQDREERRDVARIAPRATARLAADLKAFLAAAAAKRDELIARDRGRTGAPGAPTAPEIDAERIDRLRELGYID